MEHGNCVVSFPQPTTVFFQFFPSIKTAPGTDRIYIVIIMGKKSKTNRKKAPVSTAAATAAATPPAPATAVVKAGWGVNEFPESTFFVKGESFRRKGNYSKATKVYLQGIENGCVRCMFAYTMKILSDGPAIENVMMAELILDNMNLHLALPLLLEGAIRGYPDAILMIGGAYDQVRHETEDTGRYGHRQPAAPLIQYWKKYSLKNYDGELRTRMIQAKQENKEMKKRLDAKCSVCGKEDSETVTLMKCDGCKFYYYCSKECQLKMWQEGQHAGVCRQLGVLRQYHKPFATKIRTDLAVDHIAPRDIPELQELRQRLGLSRPQADYQELLEEAQARHVDPIQLILPRKDGMVQLGYFPRPI